MTEAADPSKWGADERKAIQYVAWIVGARLVLALVGDATGRGGWQTFINGTGVLLTAGALIFGGYAAVLVVLRRVAGEPADDELGAAVPGPPEPEDWTPILDRLPAVAALSERERRRLVFRVRRFLRDVRIEGCADVVVTDEVRLTIAVHACLLALNLPEGCYSALKTVLVYPTAFVAEQFSWLPSAESGPTHATLGESWSHGTVVLGWDQVQEGARLPHDGHNVALHEFAHQLDSAGGQANGVPQLPSSSRYAAWTRMLDHDFERFTREVRQGRPSVLDAYGATNRAEFFAVATETFFERPQALRHQYPDLYAQLQAYFRQDPAARALPTTAESGGPSAPSD